MERDHMDERLDEEVAFHVDMQTERNIALGMSSEEARRQAREHRGHPWRPGVAAAVAGELVERRDAGLLARGDDEAFARGPAGSLRESGEPHCRSPP